MSVLATVIPARNAAGLDPATVDNVAEMLQNLNEEGITIVMVTHDPRMAAHAARVVELVDGMIMSESGISA